jgi:sarcosine oxidase gamma subunit
MQVTTGTVVGGKIVCDGVTLAEGSVVAVLSHGPDEPFVLSPEDEEELLAAMAEIERGEFVTADDLLESLRPFG